MTSRAVVCGGTTATGFPSPPGWERGGLVGETGHNWLPVFWLQEEVTAEIRQDKVFLQGQDRQGRGVCILQGRKHTLTTTLAQQRFISYVIDGMIAACDPQRNPEGRIVAVFELQGERAWLGAVAGGFWGLCWVSHN